MIERISREPIVGQRAAGTIRQPDGRETKAESSDQRDDREVTDTSVEGQVN